MARRQGRNIGRAPTEGESPERLTNPPESPDPPRQTQPPIQPNQDNPTPSVETPVTDGAIPDLSKRKKNESADNKPRKRKTQRKGEIIEPIYGSCKLKSTQVYF